jgi:hypothetical protein
VSVCYNTFGVQTIQTGKTKTLKNVNKDKLKLKKPQKKGN